MKRWIWLLALAFILLAAAACAEGHTTLTTGNCGGSATYEIWQDDQGDVTLEISGTGAVQSGPNFNTRYFDLVDTLIVHEGITEIQSYALRNFRPRRIVLSEGLIRVGWGAFSSGEWALYTVTLPRSLTSIGKDAFSAYGLISVHEDSEGQNWCKDWGIHCRVLSAGGLNTRERALNGLVEAIAAARDVPQRYRSVAAVELRQMNSLTTAQLNSLAQYVRAETISLRTAMSDGDLDISDAMAFLGRFVAQVEALGGSVTYSISFRNGQPVVDVELTLKDHTWITSVYANRSGWHIQHLPEGDSGLFTYQQGEGGLILTGYSGSSTKLTIPAAVDGQPVIGIVEGNWPDTITSLKLPEGLKFIGDSALQDLDSLTNLILPQSLEIISDGAFNGCTSLTSVSFGNNLRVLGDAFEDTGITQAHLPASLASLSRVFDDMTIDAGNTHFEIVNGALYNRDEKALVYCWPDRAPAVFRVKADTVSIYDRAFEDNGTVTRVVLNEGLVSIGKSAFEGCGSLSTINLPSTLVQVGRDAFYGTAIGSLTIPAGLFVDPDDMGELLNLMNDMDTLRSLTVADGHPLYVSRNGALYDSDGTTLIRAPKGLDGTYDVAEGTVAIDSYALQGTGIQWLNLPEGLTEIGYSAFIDTPIEELDLPDTVTMVDTQFDMPALRYLIVPPSVTQMDGFVDCGTAGQTTVYGVYGSPAERIANRNDWIFLPLEVGTGITEITLKNGGEAISSLQLVQGQWENLRVQTDGQDGAVHYVFSDPNVVQVLHQENGSLILCGCEPGTTTLSVIPWDRQDVLATLTITVTDMRSAPSGLLVLPEGTERIESAAFKDVKARYVYIPDGVTDIDSRAFMNCWRLMAVRIPESIENLAPDAFYGCYGLILVVESEEGADIRELDDGQYYGW